MAISTRGVFVVFVDFFVEALFITGVGVTVFLLSVDLVFEDLLPNAAKIIIIIMNHLTGQCHSDKDDGKRTGTEIGSGLFFC